MPMTPEQLREFTSKPLLAVLSTVYPSGGPQALPIWYEYDGSHFIVTTFESRAKVRNLRHNPAVTLCIVDTLNSGPYIIVRGHADIIHEGAQETTRRLAIRYLGEAEGNRRADVLAQQRRVIIRITPEKMMP